MGKETEEFVSSEMSTMFGPEGAPLDEEWAEEEIEPEDEDVEGDDTDLDFDEIPAEPDPDLDFDDEPEEDEPEKKRPSAQEKKLKKLLEKQENENRALQSKMDIQAADIQGVKAMLLQQQADAEDADDDYYGIDEDALMTQAEAMEHMDKVQASRDSKKEMRALKEKVGQYETYHNARISNGSAHIRALPNYARVVKYQSESTDRLLKDLAAHDPAAGFYAAENAMLREANKKLRDKAKPRVPPTGPGQSGGRGKQAGGARLSADEKKTRAMLARLGIN